MAKADGGAAFPRPAFYPDDPADHMEPGERMSWSHGEQDGMTLRDWFAGKALVGFLSFEGSATQQAEPEYAAEWAYRCADAMLAQRNRTAVKPVVLDE